MKKIELHGKWGEGKFALVSDEDYQELSKYKWWGHLDYSTRNTTRTIYVRRYGKHRRMHYLHREIMGDKPGMFVDHINRNTLDNTRENLRHLTPRESVLNRQIYRSRKFFGTTRRGNKWQAQCGIGGKRKYIGLFNTQEEAHKHYLVYVEAINHEN